jgi:hypothetical protein
MNPPPGMTMALSRLQAIRRKRPQPWKLAGGLMFIGLGLLQSLYHLQQSLQLSKLQEQFHDFTLPFLLFPNTEVSSKNYYDQDDHDTYSRFAYAFVIGGCDPTNLPTYQNYLFNIAIAARNLKRLGSKADVVVLFQMSKTATDLQLPKEDLELLHAENVTVYYIPQQLTGRESFYRTQLDKFRILGLTQYEKVLFMDGDIMPLCNLDPFMEFEKFQENVVMEGLYEPFNGGFFMLKTGYLGEIQKVIEKREAMAAELEYPHFDFTIGWGQDLTYDPWVSLRETGTNWSFLAGFADQGLLYYYTKYHRKSVSVLHRDGGVRHYGWNGTAVTETGPFNETIDSLHNDTNLDSMIRLPGKHSRFHYPFNCFVHFTGNAKPWLLGGAPEDCCVPETQNKSAKHFWMYELSEILKEHGRTDVDIQSHWDQKKKRQRPALGLYPTYTQVINASSNIMTPLKRFRPREHS